jgi:hypothetical protein
LIRGTLTHGMPFVCANVVATLAIEPVVTMSRSSFFLLGRLVHCGSVL